MRAITVRDRAAGVGGFTVTELPYPHAAENDVIVRVHAAGFTPGELDWPATWTDRAGRDRTPSVPGHELSGVVAELGYGTTGLTVGQRVFGLADWTRDGTLAEYTAVEARNLAPLPADIEHTVAVGAADLRTDRVAGTHRPRPARPRPDRADLRRGGRRRVDRRPARR
jgi:NADPH:quinone reductase-like Zn-dependent oxidoreductase